MSRLLSLATGIALIYYGADVLICLFFAIFLYFLLDPLLTGTDRAGVGRSFTAPVLVTLVILLSGLAGWGFYMGVSRVVAQTPQYMDKIKSISRSVQGKAEMFHRDTQEILPTRISPNENVQTVAVVTNPLERWSAWLMGGINSISSLIAYMVLIPILSTFFLIEKKVLAMRLYRLIGPRYDLARIRIEMVTMVRAYFFSNVAIALATSAGFYFVMLALGLQHKVLLSVVTGFLNLVPIFGIILGAVLPGLQAVFQYSNYGPPLFWILLGNIVLHFLVNSIVLPKLVGSRINVNASSATIGLLFWGWAWGGLGLLLAIPLMATIRIVLSANPMTRNWANLISEVPSHSSLRLVLRLGNLDQAAPETP